MTMKVSSSGILPLKQTNVPTDKTKETKLFAACQELEAMVIKQMLDIMRQSVPQDGLFSGGNAEKLYQSMQDENMATERASPAFPFRVSSYPSKVVTMAGPSPGILKRMAVMHPP